ELRLVAPAPRLGRARREWPVLRRDIGDQALPLTLAQQRVDQWYPLPELVLGLGSHQGLCQLDERFGKLEPAPFERAPHPSRQFTGLTGGLVLGVLQSVQQSVGGVLRRRERWIGVAQAWRGHPGGAQSARALCLGARVVRREAEAAVEATLQPEALGRIGGSE